MDTFDDPGDWKPGDTGFRDWLNALRRFARSCRVRTDAASGLTVRTTSSGTTVRRAKPEEFWATLTGAPAAGGKYPWTRVDPVPAGWHTAARSGTTSADPAIEANGFMSVTTPVKVKLRREPGSGELIFQGDSCS